MKKRIYMGTNTKMNKNIAQTVSYLEELSDAAKHIDRSRVTIFVIPSFVSLSAARACIAERGDILLGAQNMCWEERGEFTGEISPLMLQEVGVDIVEIGHSERRNVFGETDEQIRLKVKSAVEHGFTALLCVGESYEEKQRGVAGDVLSRQLQTGLRDIERLQEGALWVAYEPVWAIGERGLPAEPKDVTEQLGRIREVLVERFGKERGERIPVLYGGSVNPGNAQKLIEMEQVNGLFVGRAAWDAEKFAAMIDSVLEIMD